MWDNTLSVNSTPYFQVTGCYYIKWVLCSSIVRSVAADGIQPKNGTTLVVQRFGILLKYSKGAHAGAVVWGMVCVWFQSVIEIFHWNNPSGQTMALGSTQPLTEMSTRNISWRVKAASAFGWQPSTLMCQMSRNLGASTSWNPQCLSRPVMGLLYLARQVFKRLTSDANRQQLTNLFCTSMHYFEHHC